MTSHPARTLLLLLATAVAVSAMPGALANPHVEPNRGTIKIHDGEVEVPPQRNVPHVSCDFFVEGFNMADPEGTLVFYSWPPTGNMSVAMVANFSGAAEGDQNGGYHFLEGPFFLAAGHYRVEAVGANESVMAKSKTFWVDECPLPPPGMECPTDIAASAAADGSITLSFTPAVNATGTNVYRAAGDGEFDYVTTLNATTTSYTDSNTTTGVVYTYILTGFYGASESTGCEAIEVTAIPEFPTVTVAVLAGIVAIGAYVAVSRRKA